MIGYGDWVMVIGYGSMVRLAIFLSADYHAVTPCDRWVGGSAGLVGLQVEVWLKFGTFSEPFVF